MTTLFILANPTQYLNAIELVTQFPDRFSDNKLIVITDFFAGFERIDQILEKNYWSEKVVFPLRSSGYSPSDWRSWRFAYLSAKKFINKIEFQQIVIGNIGDPVLYAILQTINYKGAKPIIVDDGTPTINILACRKQGLDHQRFHSPTGKQLLKSLLAFRFYIGLKKPIKAYQFFTIFPAKAGKFDEVVLNQMQTLKSYYQEQNVDPNKVFFVGSQIVDKGIVEEDVYLNALKNIVKEYKSSGKTVQYISHRSQSAEFQKKVEQIVEIVSFNLPLEFALREQTIPGTFTGFFSTALFTLNAIHYNSNVVSFEFPHIVLRNSKLESVSDVIAIYSLLNNTEGIVTRQVDSFGNLI